MTNEEMERAMDFLLKSQANLEIQIEQTNRQLEQTTKQLEQTTRQVEQTNRQLGEFADTQADFIRVMTRTWESQGDLNSSMREAQRELAAAQKRTEETVERLARKIDRLVDGRGDSGRGLES